MSHPVVGFGAFGLSTAVLYLSPLLELSARNDIAHVFVHVHLVAVGCLFFVPVIGVDVLRHPVPFGARLLALIAAVPFHAFLALAIASSTDPLAPDAYPSIDDQRSAAAILWTSGELLTLAAGAVVFARWWATESRAASRAEADDVETRR